MRGYIRRRCGRSSAGSTRAAKQREIFSRGELSGVKRCVRSGSSSPLPVRHWLVVGLLGVVFCLSVVALFR